MRFFESDTQIDTEEFAQRLPEEWALLRVHIDLEADFEVDQNGVLFLRSDFSGPIHFRPQAELEYHRGFFYKNSIYNQPLAKALGLKKGKAKPKVLDASAGTLKDTCLVLAMGMEVLACERHPVPQALILNCLRQTRISALEFVAKDVIELIKERLDFDVVYFDPMYEQKNEKAAPRKEMRIFREVVRSDTDAAETAKALLATGKRLVIKRSSKASALLPSPNMSFGRKSTAYDVYL